MKAVYDLFLKKRALVLMLAITCSMPTLQMKMANGIIFVFIYAKSLPWRGVSLMCSKMATWHI